MTKTFRWGCFSQFVEAGIVTADHLHVSAAHGGEFASKTLGAAEGDGRLEYLHAQDFRTIVANCAFHDDRRYEMVDDGLVRFHFGYDVSIQAWMNGKPLPAMVDNPAGLLVARPDEILVEQVPAGKRQTFVTIACRPEWLDRALGVTLSHHIGYDTDLSASPACHYPIRYDMALRRVVGELVESRVPHRLKPAFFAAKSKEMLIFALSSLMERSREDGYKLTERDLRAVREAHDLLRDRPESPFDLNTLSRQVGINRTKLSYGFRRLYGMSVNQFVTTHRLEHARRLLQETDMTISQIAAAVGYEHACNFSTRFKLHFDCSPRAFRSGES